MQNYVINGVKVNFNLNEYLCNSLNISRKDMPQVNMDKFYKIVPFYQQYMNIDIRQVQANQLMPTQNEINYSNVLVNAASRKLEDDQLIFICSRDLHIIDAHHRHVECLITDPHRLVKCYIFDLSTEELLHLIKKTNSILDNPVCIEGKPVPVAESLSKILIEDFGMQGPESVQGIGNIELPNVSQTSGELLDKDGRGSGDIPGSGIDWSVRLKALRKRRGEDPATGLPIDEDLLQSIQEHVNNCGLEQTLLRIINESFLTEDDLKKYAKNNIDKVLEDDKLTKYEIVCNDPEKSLMKLIEFIQQKGNTGHSFSIIVDPGDENETKFGWDGDGGDMIKSVKRIEPTNESLNENGNLKLARHFENADGLEMLTCINKPVQRKCLQIDEPFSCDTMEGVTQGKAGDFLVRGVDGEIYPCDQEIFNNTYLITGELEEPKAE